MNVELLINDFCEKYPRVRAFVYSEKKDINKFDRKTALFFCISLSVFMCNCSNGQYDKKYLKQGKTFDIDIVDMFGEYYAKFFIKKAELIWNTHHSYELLYSETNLKPDKFMEFFINVKCKN